MKKFYYLFFSMLFLSSTLSAQIVWDNFQDTRRGTYGFISGSFIPYTENPDQSGDNTSLVAASYTRNAGELFDVIILDAQMADLSDYLSGAKTMSIDVWSPAAGKTVQITLENDVLAEPANFPTGRHSVYLATTTVAMGWETLTFTFDNQPDATVANDNVNRMVLLFDPNSNNGDTYYWDNLNGPELADDPCDGETPNEDILNNFECNQNVDFTFSHAGVNFRRIPNPDQSGNASSYVASYIRNGGEEFDVIVGRFDGALSLESTDKIEMDVWDSNAPTDVTLSLQNINGDVILAMTATTSTSNAWETLTFDPSTVAAATDIEQFVILFDPGNFTADQYYWDNLAVSGVTSTNDLQEELAALEVFPNPTNGKVTFTYDLKENAQVDLSIFDATGKVVAQLASEPQAAGVQNLAWDGSDLPNGMYFYSFIIDGKVGSGKITISK